MEREMVRTCSAAEASVLVRAAGQWARVGSARLCVRQPCPADSIDPTGPYLFASKVATRLGAPVGVRRRPRPQTSAYLV